MCSSSTCARATEVLPHPSESYFWNAVNAMAPGLEVRVRREWLSMCTELWHGGRSIVASARSLHGAHRIVAYGRTSRRSSLMAPACAANSTVWRRDGRLPEREMDTAVGAPASHGPAAARSGRMDVCCGAAAGKISDQITHPKTDDQQKNHNRLHHDSKHQQSPCQHDDHQKLQDGSHMGDPDSEEHGHHHEPSHYKRSMR